MKRPATRRHGAAVRVVGPLHWVIYPALAAMAATLVLSTHVRLFGLPPPEPIFGLILAFSWPLIRPSILGPLMLFVVGIFTDLELDTTLGLWTLTFIAVYGVVLAARAFIVGQQVAVLFAWYAGLTTAAMLCIYLFTLVEAGVAPTIVGAILQWIPTVALFPLGYLLIQRFDDGDVRFR
jgi:rod shape-determining protein MreD